MNNQPETTTTNTENSTNSFVANSTSKKFTKGQLTSFATLALLLIVLPVTTSIALITTRLNSRAYLPATPPTPPTTPPITITITPTIIPTSSPSATPTPPTSCNNPVKNLKNLTPCSNNPNERFNGYMAVLVTCQNNYTETYRFKTCTKTSEIQKIASSICQKSAKCPTPTIANKPPVITTTKLNEVTINRPYTATVEATDPDFKDTVRLSVSGLPTGLKLSENCNNIKTIQSSSCKITGVVKTITANRKIVIKATDSKGATATKTLNLVIRDTKR